MAFWWVTYRQDYDLPVYKNVIVQANKTTSGTFADMILLPPWNDPQNPDQAGEISESRYTLMNVPGALFYDEFRELPRVQFDPTAGPLNDRLGSYADPVDDQSVFSKNVELADPRPVITFRFPDQVGHTQGSDWAIPNGVDPVAGEIVLFRGEKTVGETAVVIRIEGPGGWNGIKHMDLAGVPLAVQFTAGAAAFRVDTSKPGRVEVGPMPNFALAERLHVTVETDTLPIEV